MFSTAPPTSIPTNSVHLRTAQLFSAVYLSSFSKSSAFVASVQSSALRSGRRNSHALNRLHSSADAPPQSETSRFIAVLEVARLSGSRSLGRGRRNGARESEVTRLLLGHASCWRFLRMAEFRFDVAYQDVCRFSDEPGTFGGCSLSRNPRCDALDQRRCDRDYRCKIGARCFGVKLGQQRDRKFDFVL